MVYFCSIPQSFTPSTCLVNVSVGLPAKARLCGQTLEERYLATASRPCHSGLFASARATGPHREFNKYLGAPKTQPGSIEIKQFLSATSRETLFSGTACPGLVIAPVYYCRRLLSPTSDTHIGLLSPPFSASATSWRLLGHQQARLQIRVLCRP